MIMWYVKNAGEKYIIETLYNALFLCGAVWILAELCVFLCDSSVSTEEHS